MKILIGIVGEMCAGKEEFFKILTELSSPTTVIRFSTSKLLRKTLELWGLEVSRDNLQTLAIGMDGAFGEGTLTRAIANHLDNAEGDIVVYDSVRWITDEDLVRKHPSEIVYITADQVIRWQRNIRRREKVGEETMSFEEFCEKELATTETMIKVIGSHADSRIENNGTISEYVAKITEFYNMRIKPRL